MDVEKLVILALAGFVAQLIDGALGMGYGVTSSSMLLALGLAPAIVSASVHAGEIVTTLASGVAHWRFGNVDYRLTWRLGLPGAAGAFLGALLLSSVPAHLARPAVSAILLVLGIFVLVRFAVRGQRKRVHSKFVRSKVLAPLGLVAGFLDATGGGGWGPVATSTLIAGNTDEPRKVIGSVDASEFIVALAATIGFVLTLGWEGINLMWLSGIVAGGILAAPLAAWIVQVLPTDTLGVTVGAMILLTNLRTILIAVGFEVPESALVAILIVPAVLAYTTVRHTTGNRETESPTE